MLKNKELRNRLEKIDGSWHRLSETLEAMKEEDFYALFTKIMGIVEPS